MNRGDLVWGLIVAAIAGVLLAPTTRGVVLGATHAHPFLMGFAKFAILATLGELLGLRIRLGRWIRPVGFFWRAVVWGVIGAGLVLVFEVFASGVIGVINKGYLPRGTGRLAPLVSAFWISVVMNLLWAPTLMLGRRLAETYIELTGGRIFAGVSIRAVIDEIDWQVFVRFIVAKTIPFFWIPAHTLTFLVPPDYRVLAAASLSVALGVILAISGGHSREAAPRAVPQLLYTENRSAGA